MLVNYIQQCVDHLGWRGFEVIEQCFINGFYSWIDTIDEFGNLLDSEKQITKFDLQEFCNHFGIVDDNSNIVDCINF